MQLEAFYRKNAILFIYFPAFWEVEMRKNVGLKVQQAWKQEKHEAAHIQLNFMTSWDDMKKK